MLSHTMPESPGSLRPAIAWRRGAAGLLNLLLVLGVPTALPVGVVTPELRAGIALALIAMVIVCQMLFSAGPGGLLLGLRLRRGMGGLRPTASHVLRRVFLLLVACVASLGTAPVVMLARMRASDGRRTWWDRMSDTVVMASVRKTSGGYTLVTDQGDFPVTGVVVVGRAPQAYARRAGAEVLTLFTEDTSVSKVHARLEPRPDGVLVQDLGSMNGTEVEGPAGLRYLEAGGSEVAVRGARVYFGDAGCLVW